MGGVRTSDVGGFIQILLRLYLIWYYRFYHRNVWNTVKYDEHGDRSSDISVFHTQNVIYLYIKIKLKTNRNLIQASQINKFSFLGFWRDLKITFKKLFNFFFVKKIIFDFCNISYILGELGTLSLRKIAKTYSNIFRWVILSTLQHICGF